MDAVRRHAISVPDISDSCVDAARLVVQISRLQRLHEGCTPLQSCTRLQPTATAHYKPHCTHSTAKLHCTHSTKQAPHGIYRHGAARAAAPPQRGPQKAHPPLGGRDLDQRSQTEEERPSSSSQIGPSSRRAPEELKTVYFEARREPVERGPGEPESRQNVRQIRPRAHGRRPRAGRSTREAHREDTAVEGGAARF